MSLLSARLGVQLHPAVADAVESAIRAVNVVVSHVRAHRYPGLVIMDRHLHCQLALRQARGLSRGLFLPWLLKILPKPDLVIHLVVDPEQAHQRVLERGTDTESLDELRQLRDAYRSLPEYAQFTEVAAEGTPAEVLSGLMIAVDAKRAVRARCPG
jgi:dTMP kinase